MPVAHTNADNARIYGSDYDMIWVAPLGTPFPETLTEDPPAPWQPIGWLHSDGITETPSGSPTQIRGYQGNGVVKTRMESPGTQIKFVALEDTDLTRGLRYDVKSSSTTSGVRREKRGPGQKVTPMAAMIDVFDDGQTDVVHERSEIKRFEMYPDGDRVLVNNDIAGFGFIGEIIGDYEVATTVPAPGGE